MAAKIVPVILSGGGGTRLWPMSRPERPKQFLALTSERTMFELTVARIADPDRFDAPVIVANVDHETLVREQLGQAGLIILEPCARNTAPAIALAALSAPSPDAPLLVLPSDHVITDEAAFQSAIAAALPHVQAGWLATFGITPTGPETGYGYIQLGDALSEGVHAVTRFVEKPDATRAAALIADGQHVWNGGIFLFRADTYLAELEARAPEICAAARKAFADGTRDGDILRPAAQAFAASPSDSIDYAVMEKAARVAVVPVDMGWSDLGSWDALYDLGTEPESNHVLALDAQDCLIRSDGIRIQIVGVSDLIVVASGNDVLIVPRGQSQDVKRIVDVLKARDG